MTLLNFRRASSLAFLLASCVSSPSDDDGGAGEAGARDGGAGEAGARDGGAGEAGARDGGEGGVASGRGGSAGTIDPGGAPNASGGAAESGASGVDGGSGGASNEGGAPANGGADAAGGATAGDAGDTSSDGGASYGGSPGGNGGADEGGAPSGSAGASGGVPSGQGGSGDGGSPAGNAGDTASGGAPQGGEGGTGELPCVVDLLPADAFRTALWSEFTYCEEINYPFECPTEFPPIISDGAAHFSSELRQAGTAWYLSVSTLVTIPPDAIYATLDWSEEFSCELGGGSATLGASLGGTRIDFSSDVTELAGQSVPLVLFFSQASGPPCVATIRDVTLQAQRCQE